MSDRNPDNYVAETYAENPAIPEDAPATRPDFETGVDPERPQELVNRMEQIEQRDETLRGQPAERPYALQGEDEGPLGEGGQLRGPDAGGGGGQ